MKNIHVLPTDKPSKLAIKTNFLSNEEKLHLRKGELFTNGVREAQNQHIYITSDEEIKYNDYITDGYKVWQWKDDSSLLGRKKVVLTTDQDLIEDGVQAIDDEFLEWFVKNPSCELVEVEYGDDGNGYQPILPKEKTKQECKDCNKSLEDCTCIEDTIELPNQALKDAAERLKGKELFKESNDRARKILSEIKSLPIQERYEKYSERFDNDESAIGNPETWGKRVLTEEDIFNQRDIDAVTDYIGKETSKQETIEEAAEKYCLINNIPTDQMIVKNNRSCEFETPVTMFIKGAKWQAERMYSGEEVEDLIYKVCGTVARLQGITLNGNHIDTAYKKYKKK